MSETPEQPKQDLSQMIEETGVTSDYFNEVIGLSIFWSDGGVVKIAELLGKHPVRKYRELYPEDVYADVVTEHNRSRIERLDELADLLNTMTDPTTFTAEDFVSAYNEFADAIYGTKGTKDHLVLPEEFAG